MVLGQKHPSVGARAKGWNCPGISVCDVELSTVPFWISGNKGSKGLKNFANPVVSSSKKCNRKENGPFQWKPVNFSGFSDSYKILALYVWYCSNSLEILKTDGVAGKPWGHGARSEGAMPHGDLCCLWCCPAVPWLCKADISLQGPH